MILGFTWVNIIFSFSLLNIDCGYSFEAVLTCTNNLCFEQNKIKLKIAIFYSCKNHCILHRRVIIIRYRLMVPNQYLSQQKTQLMSALPFNN